MTNEWVHPHGSLSVDAASDSGHLAALVDSTLEGWEHTGFAHVVIPANGSVSLPAEAAERVVIVLAGHSVVAEYTVDGGTDSRVLLGRKSVFHGPADALYLPTGTALDLRSETPVRVAVCSAPTTVRKPVQFLAAADVPVELRGAGRSSRQVHNFATTDGLDCVKLLACEVVTPAENWSSYPPHKHDEHVPGTESRLEEIYYFETEVTRGARDSSPAEADPFAFFATYSSPAGAIDTAAMVRTGDVALVPYGYHGPAAAAPGYDLYYLNVMAGPDDERVWHITDDPAHGWVREGWESQEFDSRLPYGPEDTHIPDTHTDEAKDAR